MDSSTDESYWEEIVSAFPILSKNEHFEPCNNEQFVSIRNNIVKNKLVSFVHGMIMVKIKQDLMSKIKDFWIYFIPHSVVELTSLMTLENIPKDYTGFEKFKTVIDKLSNLAQSHNDVINRLQMLFKDKRINLEKNMNAQICAILHSQLPGDYNMIIYEFYRTALKVFIKDETLEDQKKNFIEEDISCNECCFDLINCKCDYILESFHLTNWRMINIGILEPLAGDVIIDLIHQKIETKVQNKTKGAFGECHITALEKWLDTIVYEWMKYIYKPKYSTTILLNDTNIGNFMKKLKYYLYESYTRARIDQLFNIIIEYPDSEPAVIDLSFTLKKTHLKSELSTKLQNDLYSRLLHSAVNTIDIITAYTAGVKVLRKIDPSGALLQEVTQPLRAYLRTRKDTVRCVMSTLTEEDHYLTDELGRTKNVLDEDNAYEEDMSDWMSWVPDPIDANQSKSSKRFRNSDTVSTLIDIYGTRELFVNEYRSLLADRLLTQFMDNIDNEMRSLELLKLRFGDSLLHSCSVMIKDVFDSKRINHHLYSDPTSNLISNNLNSEVQFPVKAIIVSNQFWPNFKDNFNVKLPPILQKHFDNYTKAFESLKSNRTLNWKPNLGIVKIDLEMKDKTLSFTVSPIHATIIWHFEEKEEWTINDLSIKMGVPATTLRRRIGFWQNQGILREKSLDSFIFVENGIPTTGLSRKSNQSSFVGRNSEFVYGDDDDQVESAVASIQDQRKEELQVFWSYIVGMLTNLNSLPLDRIHQMLKMFATQGTGVECSLTELRSFLDEKVKQHLLVFTGGQYKLVK